MAVLVLSNGNLPEQVIELAEPEILIGRLPECAVQLDPNGVSRRHAKIVRRDGQFYLVDLESRNKTKLNEKVIEPLREHLLQPSDRINICDVEMVFHVVYQPDSSSIQSNGELDVVDTNDTTIHTLDASRSDLVTASVKPEVKLKAILEISRNLSSSLKIDTVAPKILESLLEIFGQAERAFMVLLKEDEAKKWSIRQTFHKLRSAPKRPGLPPRLGAAPADEARLSISRAIINHVLGNKNAVLSQDAGNDLNLPTSASIADLKIRSVMCAPLLGTDGQAMGILQLDTTNRMQFSQDDLDVLLAVAGQAAIALQNAAMHESLLAQERIRNDLNLAQTIQVRFLPRHVPEPPGFEFFAHYHAAYHVGGDYYDFVDLGDGKLAIALGDVAGKGVPAALMMAKFSGDTRACLLTERGPAAAATKINRLLCSAGIDERFITLSLSLLDVPSRTLTIASAGHLPLLIRRADGRVEEVGEDVSGYPLGIDGDSTYDQAEIRLEPGDVVVVHSDGVTDARSPGEELYDSQDNHRLKKRVAAGPGTPAGLGRAILQEIREFSAGHPQADDITLICFGPKREG
jgi:serine phosphatase RsbU (regulator of sigma subunit)/pSer/pThr/pTyr-binding forkhead associated (FHA) protein